MEYPKDRIDRPYLHDLIVAQRKLRDIMLQDPHRPTYHFVSPEGACMPFDPNGAAFWKGRYHLCYIFENELGYCWGHASSLDLLHWRHHKAALMPQSDQPKSGDGVFSGNCFVDDNGQAVIFYHGCKSGNCIAVCQDDELDNWRKLPGNPIVPIPPEGSSEEQLYSSWDPHGWRQGETYYSIFGGPKPTVFKSDRLEGGWEYVGPLLAHNMPDVDEKTEDVSCPDLFRLGDMYVLLCISHNRGARYYTGRWEHERFFPEKHHRMNWEGGTCFAPETLLDGRRRRIMWAWVLDNRQLSRHRNSSPLETDFGWSGTMSLPRVLTAGAEGTLNIDPVEELNRLRYDAMEIGSTIVAPGRTLRLSQIEGNCLELEMTAKLHGEGSWGMRLCCAPDGSEQTVVEFDNRTGEIRIDVSRSSSDKSIRYYSRVFKHSDDLQADQETFVQVAPFKLATGEQLRLRVFVDRSILEVFANSRQCVTQRIYPTRNDSLGVELFSRSATVNVLKMTAWRMAAANPY